MWEGPQKAPVPKSQWEVASRPNPEWQGTLQESTAALKEKRESACRAIESIPDLSTLDVFSGFQAYLRQWTTSLTQIEQLAQLARHLLAKKEGARLLDYFDSSAWGKWFPDGKGIKLEDLLVSFAKEFSDINATAGSETASTEISEQQKEISDKQWKAETERQKAEMVLSLTSDLRTGAGAAFTNYFENATVKQGEKEIKLFVDGKITDTTVFLEIAKKPEVIKAVQAELLTNARKSQNFETYERVATNFRNLGVINEREFIDWIGAERVVSPEWWAQPPKPEMAFGGYERHGDTFIKPGTEGGPSMMIADGKMMCIGESGFKLSSYFPNQDMERRYVEYRQKFESLSAEKIQKEALAKNLGSILEKIGPITDNISAEEFVQRITEAAPFNNSSVKDHFREFLEKNPNMRREDKIKAILDAILRFAELPVLPKGMPLMLSLHNVRYRLWEKNKHTAESILQIDDKIKKLKTPELGRLETEQERKERLMTETVKYVEALWLDCFGSRADIQRLLQKFQPELAQPSEGFQPDIGSGRNWMSGPKTIQTLCTIISTITWITPKESIYDNLNWNPPTLMTILPTEVSTRLRLPQGISVRQAMRSALESNGVVKGGIFDVDAARNIYQLSRVQAEQAARNSREQADRAAEQAQVTRLVEGTEVSTSEYIVKPGDNLTKIAHKHGITLTELLQANKDIDPKKPIHPKDRIVIPARKPEASKPAEAPAK